MKLNPLFAQERTDEHFVQKHKSIMDQVSNNSFDVVFFGDSITRRWEDNIDLWKRFFSKWNVGNFGIGSDTIENLKWRMENGELKDLRTKLMILLIGTNNLPVNRTEEIKNGIYEIIRLMKRSVPTSKIVVLGLFPRAEDEKHRKYMQRIHRINKLIANNSRSMDYRFVNIGYQLFEKRGKLLVDNFADGLHLNSIGYERLGPYMQDLIEAELGSQ